jgi:hypothetical protein
VRVGPILDLGVDPARPRGADAAEAVTDRASITSARRSRQLPSRFVGTFEQLIDKLDADDRVKGHQFERIAKWFNPSTAHKYFRRSDKYLDLQIGYRAQNVPNGSG